MLTDHKSRNPNLEPVEDIQLNQLDDMVCLSSRCTIALKRPTPLWSVITVPIAAPGRGSNVGDRLQLLA